MINKNFSLVLAGQLISQVGDKFHMIALSFWTLETTGSALKMGAVLAASLVPGLILGFFSGTFIDRSSRKMILVGTDLFRGLVLGGFALLFVLGKMEFHWVLILQVILSINAAFFDPTLPAIIPQIVPQDQLARANALHQFVSGFALISGAMLGGISVAGLGYFWVFLLNGISFVLSALLESWIDLPRVQGPRENSWVTDMKQGYGYLFENQWLWVLLAMVMVIHFFVGSIEVFMPVIAHQISEAGPKTLGFFQAALGSGTLVMALVLGMGIRVAREGAALFASTFFIGLVLGVCFWVQGTYGVLMFMVCLFFMGNALILASISFRTLVQTRINPRYSGRIFALATSLGNASIPGAMILYGLLLDWFDFQGLLLFSGLGLMLASLICFIVYKEKPL